MRCEVDSDQLEELLRLLVPAGVRTLVSQPPTLEELFLRHYAERRREAASRTDMTGRLRAVSTVTAPVAGRPGADGGPRSRPPVRLARLRARASWPGWPSGGTGSCWPPGFTR